MNTRTILTAASVGLTVASFASTVGAMLLVKTVKDDGVALKLPAIGTVDVDFKGKGPAAVILSPTSQSILSALPAFIAIAAVAATFGAAILLSADDRSGGSSTPGLT